MKSISVVILLLVTTLGYSQKKIIVNKGDTIIMSDDVVVNTPIKTVVKRVNSHPIVREIVRETPVEVNVNYPNDEYYHYYHYYNDGKFYHDYNEYIRYQDNLRAGAYQSNDNYGWLLSSILCLIIVIGLIIVLGYLGYKVTNSYNKKEDNNFDNKISTTKELYPSIVNHFHVHGGSSSSEAIADINNAKSYSKENLNAKFEAPEEATDKVIKEDSQ